MSVAANVKEVNQRKSILGTESEFSLLPVPTLAKGIGLGPAPRRAAGADQTRLAIASASLTRAMGTLPLMPKKASYTARSSASPEPVVHLPAATITSGSTTATTRATRAAATACMGSVAPSNSTIPFVGAEGPWASPPVGMFVGLGVVVLGLVAFEWI